MLYPVLVAVIVLLCLGIAWRTRTLPWLAYPRTAPSDRPYLWQYETTRKHKPVASRIGISAAPPFSFVLEKERLTHRLSKALGFCDEFQTQSPEFNARVFVLSDNIQLQQALRASPHLQQRIVQAFASGVRDIRATATHLIARLEKTQENPPPNVDPILDTLHALKESISRMSRPPAARTTTQAVAVHVFRRLPLILITLGFANIALILLFDYQIIRWHPIVPYILRGTVIILFSALIAMRILFRQSSQGHDVLFGFLRHGGWGAVFCSATLAAFANCYYDTSPAQPHAEKVVDKYITHGRKSTNYLVHIKDWGAEKMLSLQVNKAFYTRLKPGDDIIVTSYAGKFGMEWVAKLEQLKHD